MNKSQILVKSITPVVNVIKEEQGRYSVIVPLSSIIGAHSVGVLADFFDMKGKSISGRVVDVSERVREGKFPQLEGIIIDTRWETYEKGQLVQPKRMASGGIQRLQPRVPAQPKPNKRAQP